MHSLVTRLRSIVGEEDPSENDDKRMIAALNLGLQHVCTAYDWPTMHARKLLLVPTDTSVLITLTAGSSTFTGTGLVSRVFDGHILTINGLDHRIAWIKNSTTGYLTTAWSGTTGTYTATMKAREIYMPADFGSLIDIRFADGTVIAETTPSFRSRWQWYAFNVTPGTMIVPPRRVTGNSIVSASGAGARTINLYMYYRQGNNSGITRDSALSPPLTVELSATQTIALSPAAIPNSTGYYQGYCFTCEEAGITNPMFVPTNPEDFTPDNTGSITVDFSLGTLESPATLLSLKPWNKSNGTWQAISFERDLGQTQPIEVMYRMRPPTIETDETAIPLSSECQMAVVYHAAAHYCGLTRKNDAQVFASKATSLLASVIRARRSPLILLDATPRGGHQCRDW